jgi:hypothetical protein
MNSRAIGDLLNYSYNSVRERMTKVWDKDNEFRVLDVMHLDELSSGAKRSKFGPMSFLEVAINHKIKRLNFEKPRQTKEEFMGKVLQKLAILGITADVDSRDQVTVSILSSGLTPVPRGTVNNGGEKKAETSSPPQAKDGNRSPRSEGTAKSEEEGTFTVENFLKNSQKFENALENMLESISKAPSNGNSRKRKPAVDDDAEFELSRPKKRRASDRSSSSVASDASVHSAEEDSARHILTSVEEDVNLFLRYAILAERTPMVH